MPRGPAQPHPPMTIEDAAPIATALKDYGAGKAMNRILLVAAMVRSPGSSDFRYMTMAADRYGLVEGTYTSEPLALTKLR